MSDKNNNTFETRGFSAGSFSRACILLRWICDGLLILVVLMAALCISGRSGGWICGPPASPFFPVGGPIASDVFELQFSAANEALMGITGALPWLCYFLLVWQFRQLFSAYRKVPFFTEAIIIRLRNIGILAVAVEVVQAAEQLVQYKLIQSPDIAVLGSSSIPLTSVMRVNIPSMLLGAGFIVLSMVMRRAVTLENESEFTV